MKTDSPKIVSDFLSISDSKRMIEEIKSVSHLLGGAFEGCAGEYLGVDRTIGRLGLRI